MRYLESGQFDLVKKALQERRTLLRLAPGLVKPVPFFIPVYKSSRRKQWTLRAGLSLYALLSGFEPLGCFRQIPRSRWHTLRDLNTDELEAVFQYWDAQTDDRLLTQAVVNSAVSLGADAHCPATFEEAEKTPQGYCVSYQWQKQQRQCQVRMLINAAGPWVNPVLARITPLPDRLAVDWVQGSHLVIDRPAPDRVYYLESIVDERVVFVMPWQGKTMIGTTEVNLSALPETIAPSAEEEAYLLTIYRHYFPDAEVEVIDRFAGVRVLPKSSSSVFDRPRDGLIYRDPLQPRLLTLYGGKLTTFRALAKEVVNEVVLCLGGRQRIANVDRLSLMPDAEVACAKQSYPLPR